MKLFNIFRFPITKTIEAPKTVTLWQVQKHDTFWMMNNLQGEYAPLHHMEPVFTMNMKGDDETILHDCFEEFNGACKGTTLLNYSMSAGDVVEINSTFYRCLPRGWARA